MSKKILIVDDEPELVDMVKMRLEANNYTVVTAADGADGFKKAKEEKPDLIILDIMMPKVDGYTFVRESRASDEMKSTPIIVLSAKERMQELFKIEGITHYLLKPFDAGELLKKIAELIED